MNNPISRAKAGKTLYCMTMQTCSLLAMSVCTASLWAQADTQTTPHDADSSASVILDDSSSGWSPTDLSLRGITFYWENDGTLPNTVENTDRYYTNGTGIELSFDPNFSDELANKLAPAGQWNDPRFGFGLAIKQQIRTGIDITDPNPASTDHPYSGYLYFAFSFQRADDKKHDHFELDLGTVGERAQGEMIQKWVHNTFPNQDEPQGWGHQLANELTVNFTYVRTWKTEPGEIAGIEFEMLPAIGFEIGNVSTRARAQFTTRVGLHLPDDFGPASLLGHNDHTYDASGAECDWSIYMYTTLGIDAVAHSIFLDGNTFSTSPSVDSEPFVVHATFGVVGRYKSVYLGWAQNLETETFETQPDRQTFGSLVLGCTLSF